MYIFGKKRPQTPYAHDIIYAQYIYTKESHHRETSDKMEWNFLRTNGRDAALQDNNAVLTAVRFRSKNSLAYIAY